MRHHQQLNHAPRYVIVSAMISLLVFLLITALWVHTHVQDTWAVYHTRGLPDENAQIEIHGRAGGLWVMKYSEYGPNPQLLMRVWLWPAVLGSGLLSLTCVGVALWPKVQRLRALSRADSGLCPRCGYDLRATPNQCPECGAAAGPAARTAA